MISAALGVCVWLRPLFGDVAPSERRQGLRVALLIAAGTGLSLLRQDGLPAFETIWAEDGARFLNDAIALPPSRSILLPYAGYLHVWPRLIGELAAALPLDWAAVVFALVGAGLAGAVGAFVYMASGGHLQSVATRVALALAVTLTPTAGYEGLNSVTPAQFPLALAVFWALLWRPRTVAGTVVACALVVIGTLSSPLTAAFLPVAVARLLALPAWRERAPAVFALLGVAAQVWVAVSEPFLSLAGARLGDIVWAGLTRIALPVFAGVRASAGLWLLFGPPVAVAAGLAVIVVGLLALLAPAASRHARLLMVASGGCAFGLAVSSLWLRGGAATMRWTPHAISLGGQRYAYLPILLFVCVVAVMLDERHCGISCALWRTLRSAAFVVLAVPMALDLRLPNDRSSGLVWREQVSRATTECRTVEKAATVEIPHPPNWPGFVVTVPCASLR